MTVQPMTRIPERRRANKAELAHFFDVTPRTVDQWVSKGCPVVQRGMAGVPWMFDLLEVALWKYGNKPEEGSEEFDPEKLSPGERKAWYESEVKRRDLQVRDRELIPSAEAQTAIATAFAAISQGLRAIPDNLERRAGITPEIAEAVEAMLNEEMSALADRLATLSPVEAFD